MRNVAIVFLLLVGCQKPEEAPVVTFLSPTECKGNHGVWRWAAKTDEEQPPDTAEETTIAEMASWEPLEVSIHSARTGRELQWFTLVGQVQLVKAEDDGDLHVQLADGDGPQVVVEVPLGEPWSAIREEVFRWADVTFPCHPHVLALKKQLKIRVTGKAFFDGYHQGDVPNRRSYDPDVTCWEIHPVMRLEVIE